MTLSLKNLTFIIVTFKSRQIIEDVLDSMPKKSEIYCIDNSNNKNLKKDLEKNIINVR
jgi:2-hydroxy-3-keto-5-methylthiopentenyl-1-phosphate phosphatase